MIKFFFQFVVFKNLRPTKALNCHPKIILVQVSKRNVQLLFDEILANYWDVKKEKDVILSYQNFTWLNGRGHIE